MSTLQPSSLSDEELAHYGLDLIKDKGLPLQWQLELMNRFTRLLDAEIEAEQN